MFLYIVPLKQGLKPVASLMTGIFQLLFLYIVPLKQGLKQLGISVESISSASRFLYIVPLKQGLKPTVRD